MKPITPFPDERGRMPYSIAWIEFRVPGRGHPVVASAERSALWDAFQLLDIPLLDLPHEIAAQKEIGAKTRS